MNTQEIQEITVAEDKSTTENQQNNNVNVDLINNNSNTEIPDNIDANHWNEWLESGVNPDIIRLNVRSIHDGREVDKVLSRNVKKRWQHSNNLTPCWQVSGVDPFTGEHTLQGVQIKPDVSPLNREGRPQKYIGASGYGASPLFLETGIEGYWPSVLQNMSIPLYVLEGAKKAACLLSYEYAAMSIPGVSTCRKNGRLHYLIKPFNGFGRRVYLCFDNDVLSKKPVQDALLKMGIELSDCGSKVMVVKLPAGEHKGVDDFIAANGKEAFDELVKNAVTIEEWRQEIKEQWLNQGLDIDEEPKSKLSRYMNIVREGWGESLRLNKLRNTIELNGSELDLNHIRLRIALEFDTDVPLGDAQGIVEMLANENAYHPVANYLDTLSLAYSNVDTSILDNLATRYFGSDNPIHNIYMKKTLIAAVARIREPGCKHDEATILVGKQGSYKSTFWKKLFGDDWFSDELGDASEKDELMKLHRFWCLEWSEFETVYRKKDVSALKKFMSTTVDSFRTPYSRVVRDYPRGCLLVGTTNETEILTDPTGSRRFWIIPISGSIPVELVERERDQIWAAAEALYRAGERHDLTPEEKVLQQEANLDFEIADPWMEPVADYIRGREWVTPSQILTALQIEVGRQSFNEDKRVKSILRRLKWEPTRRRVNGGENLRIWIFSENLGNSTGTPGTPGTLLPKNENEYQNSEGGTPKNEVNQENIPKELEHPQNNSQQGFQDLNSQGVPGVPVKNPEFSEKIKNNQQGSDPTAKTKKPVVIRMQIPTPIGVIFALGKQVNTEMWELCLKCPNEQEIKEMFIGDKESAEKQLKAMSSNWNEQFTYEVQTHAPNGYDYVSVSGCKIVMTSPSPSNPKRGSWLFQSPNGQAINVYHRDDWKLEQ